MRWYEYLSVINIVVALSSWIVFCIYFISQVLMKVCFFVQDTYPVRKNLYGGSEIKHKCAYKTLSALPGTLRLQLPVCSA